MVFTFGGLIIESLKKQLGLDEKFTTVIKIWDDVLGPLAKDAQLVGIKRGQLLVDVTSSAHFQELTLRRREIISKINQYFGKEAVVKDIRLRIKTED